MSDKIESVGDVSLLSLYVRPHEKISRKVEEKDIPVIVEYAEKLQKLCHTRSGIYPSAFAIAHCQINDTDPLRFYVTWEGNIIINPVILRHTRNTVSDLEGCLSFPRNMPVKVERWYKLELCYDTLEKDGDSYKLSPRVANLKGREARIAQHEQDHLDGKMIYSLDSFIEDVIINEEDSKPSEK